MYAISLVTVTQWQYKRKSSAFLSSCFIAHCEATSSYKQLLEPTGINYKIVYEKHIGD